MVLSFFLCFLIVSTEYSGRTALRRLSMARFSREILDAIRRRFWSWNFLRSGPEVKENLGFMVVAVASEDMAMELPGRLLTLWLRLSSFFPLIFINFFTSAWFSLIICLFSSWALKDLEMASSRNFMGFIVFITGLAFRILCNFSLWILNPLSTFSLWQILLLKGASLLCKYVIGFGLIFVEVKGRSSRTIFASGCCARGSVRLLKTGRGRGKGYLYGSVEGGK
mmetsp:Transcript_4094/g.7662  ORF Transcript_4094/g.7662 Transcript_4094/m.7662 type:complete len:224 (+) Transcript_4094:423-1094(+)